MIDPRAEPVPGATVARLPSYLRALGAMAAAGIETTSSTDLAEAAGAHSAQLRRDLSYFGSLGVRGVGYDVTTLRAELAAHVGSEEMWPVVIVGVGNLGSALTRQFSRPPFLVVAAMDTNPGLVGKRRGGVRIRPQSELAAAVAETGAIIGVIAVPEAAAQDVCDALVAAGVRGILNFSPGVLAVPADVNLRSVDLVQELQILAFHEQHRPR